MRSLRRHVDVIAQDLDMGSRQKEKLQRKRAELEDAFLQVGVKASDAIGRDGSLTHVDLVLALCQAVFPMGGTDFVPLESPSSRSLPSQRSPLLPTGAPTRGSLSPAASRDGTPRQGNTSSRSPQ